MGFFEILAYKLIFDPAFHIAEHFFGNVDFLQQLADPDKRVGEWGIILNLFGSSAGVAITSKFSEARHMLSWLKNGWHVALAYVVGFAMYMLILGWHPADTRLHKIDTSTEIPKGIQGNLLGQSGFRM